MNNFNNFDNDQIAEIPYGDNLEEPIYRPQQTTYYPTIERPKETYEFTLTGVVCLSIIFILRCYFEKFEL